MSVQIGSTAAMCIFNPMSMAAARYAKNVPGRKTDVSDAAWLRQLHSYGLLRGSFLPDAEIATLRAYLRQRERLVEYAAGGADGQRGQASQQAFQAAAEDQAGQYTVLRCEDVLGVDLTEIHGLGPSLALKLIGECGTDLRAWPTSKHFTPWLCLAPGNKISGGKVLSSRTRRSSSWAAALLRLAAATIGRSDTTLGAFYRRLSSRAGGAISETMEVLSAEIGYH